MKNDKKLEEYSDPNSVPLVLDIEDIKIPLDTVDNRLELINNASEDVVSGYGRPQLNLSKEEIRRKYRKKDLENLKILKKYYDKGIIDKETYETLCDYFGNSEELYEGVKKSLNEFMGCEPKAIKYINLLDGTIDHETPYFDEHIGPDTTMILEYEIPAPWRVENKIPDGKEEKITVRIIVPMMKDVIRTIDKVKIGGKYDLERQKELAKLKPGQTIEEAGLDKPKLRKPIEKLKDVFRCTLLAPRFDDILALYTRSIAEGRVTKSSRPSKYLDNDVKRAQEFFKNSKNYRDMKNYLHIYGLGGKRFFCEMQYKTEIQFFKADTLTHPEYEITRKLQEMFYNAKTEGDRQVLNAKIYKQLLSMQKINANGFELYNLSVMQDMRKAEDRLKALGIKPEKDGTYALCRELADKCLLVRSSMALTDETFDNSPAWAKDIYKRYSKDIDKKYLVDIRTNKIRYNKQGTR
ncbi:MAG: hypothetical protein E7019_04595 [Alphaproteobacteria bacterium]|nr:hypothetical protein [Alphaproteobacteria bacterium]